MPISKDHQRSRRWKRCWIIQYFSWTRNNIAKKGKNFSGWGSGEGESLGNLTRPSFECSATSYRQYKILPTHTKAQDKGIFPSPLPRLPGMLPPHGRPAPGEGARTPTKRGSCSNECSRLISAAVPAPVPRD